MRYLTILLFAALAWAQLSVPVLDLLGSGSPVGACVTGQRYTDTSTTPGRRIWLCVNSAWEQQGGIVHAIFVQALSYTLGTGATEYFGALPTVATTTAGINKVYIRRSGAIKVAELYSYSVTAGSVGAWSVYIRLNNTTDTLIATVNAATNERVFSNTALNIPVVTGDYFEIKTVNPQWKAQPSAVVWSGRVFME